MGESAGLPSAPFYQALREAFGETGCPVCRLVTSSADRYLAAILWEMVNDPSLRHELNLARGYCREHGWMLVRAGAALGIAILTRDVIKTLLRVVDSCPTSQSTGTGGQSLRRLLGRERSSKAGEQLAEELAPQTTCPACAHSRSIEEDTLSTLVEHLDGPGGLGAVYGESDGLCLAHFCGSLERVPTDAGARRLVAAQRNVWLRLDGELGEFIRKNDYRFRDEGFGAERDAWLRALEAVSGPQPLARSDRAGL